ncbi:MAG: putative toxin-antitoxin system toxin component, PIN family [bacterium]
MTRIVLDTSVLVSGMINAFGAPGRIIDLVREGNIELIVDDRLLAEYTDVLNRPKFRTYFNAHDVRDILIFLEQNAHYVVSTIHVTNLPDPDDTPFLEVALSAGVPLVTGNMDDFPSKLCRTADVLTPARFLEQLDGSVRDLKGALPKPQRTL